MFYRLYGHVRGNVVGYVALFVALSGTAVAATRLPANSVGTKQLRNGAVTGKKVARNTLTGANINVSTLGTVPNAAALGGLSPSAFQLRVSGVCAGNTAISQITATGSVSCQPTGTGTITGVNAATGLAGGGSSGNVTLSVANNGIGTSQLADAAVTTAKFASGAQAPDSAQLNSLPANDYGALLSGRINGLATASGTSYGAASGISNASGTESTVYTLSPAEDLVARDLSVKLTAAPGHDAARQFFLRVNGSHSDASFRELYCVVYDLSTTCSASGPLSVPAGSTLSLEVYSFTYGSYPAATDALFAFRLTPR